jgi:hypothetical protein
MSKVGEFDQLIESVNFKKIEKEDLTKFYSKKKWLQKSPTFLNQIILKDLDDDDEEGSGSEKDSEEEEEEDEDEEEEGSSSVPKWDKKLSSAYYIFSNKDKSLTYTYSSSSWFLTLF